MNKVFFGPQIKVQLSSRYSPDRVAEIILHNEPFEKIVSITLIGKARDICRYGKVYILIKGIECQNGRIEVRINIKSQAFDSITSTYYWDLKSPKASKANISKEVDKAVMDVCNAFCRRINEMK